MKKLITLVSFILLLIVTNGYGQLTGTKTIGIDYATIAAAVTALNGSGVGAGGVIFNVPAGWTETIPTGGYVINIAINQPTSLNTVTFQKSGAGNNPLVSSLVTGSGSIGNAGLGLHNDGFFRLVGTDYITINGIDVKENYTGITQTLRMEYGFILERASATDGCKNVTIKNCRITLYQGNIYSSGITTVNYNGSGVLTNPTTIAGRHENIFIDGCTITDAFNGMYFNGYADLTSPYNLYENNIQIGVTSANTLIRIGLGLGLITSANTEYGIYFIYCDSIKVYNNTVRVNTGNNAATHYGIFTSTGTNSNVDINNNTVSDTCGYTTAGASSQQAGIYNTFGATGTNNIVSITNNTVSNCYYPNAVTPSVFYIAQTANAFTVNISGNTVTNNSVGGGAFGTAIASVYGIYNSALAVTTAGSTYSISSNIISNLTRTQTLTSTGTLYGIYMGAGNLTTNINGNNISNLSNGTTSSTLAAIYDLTTVTGGTLNIYSNVINNINKTSGVTTGPVYGIYASQSAATTNVYSNTVTNLSIASGGSGVLYGYYNFGVGTVSENFYNNTFNSFTNNGTSVIYGAYIQSGSLPISKQIYSNQINTLTGNSTIYAIIANYISPGNIYKNRIYGITTNSVSGGVYGLYVSTTITSVNIYNNMIHEIKAPVASSTLALAGMYIAGGTAYNIYYNSIYLDASSSATSFGTAALYMSTTPTADLRNNIFINKSTPGSISGNSVAYYRSSSTLTTYSASSNNNLFYAGATGFTNKLIYYDGINSDNTLAAFKTRVSPRDNNSVTENTPFVNTTISPYNIHVSTSVATVCEGGGLPITGYTDDYDGDLRNVSYPDIGADEFNGIDGAPPVITYTLLSNTTSTTDRAFTNIIITDASGVNATPGTRPRCYYKKSTDNNTFVGNTSLDNGWKYVEANGLGNSPFDFTISYALLFGGLGVLPGDVVQYFVVAQDNAATPNVGINSGIFAANPSSVNLTSAAFPLTGTINSYSIQVSFSGTYNVGTGQTYTSLTNAGGLFQTINNGLLSGSVTVNIVSDITETGANALNQWTESPPSSNFTLTIGPDGFTNRTLSGSYAGALIRLNGADRVTIDGSYFLSGKYLTFQNTSAAATTGAIQLISLGTALGATNNTIKNCYIRAGTGTTLYTYGIGITGATLGSTGADNDNNTIQNNDIASCTYGIWAFGTSATSTGGIDNLSITGNSIGSNTIASYVTYQGLRLSNIVGLTISQNTIFNISHPSTAFVPPVAGIQVSTGVSNGTISKNIIYNVTSNLGIGYGARGISIDVGVTGANTTISNNVIYGVVSDGGVSTLPNYNPIGIAIVGGTGYNLYYNSISMTGTRATNAYANTAAMCMYNSGTGTIDVRNNSFYINQNSNNTLPGKNYGFYSASANTAYSFINNNDYYATSSTTGLLSYVGFLGADQTTLANWQTATGQDLNSVSGDPVYNSTSDLRPQPGSPLLSAGTSVSVTDDILGVSRSLLTPTIGAYENSADFTGPVITYTPLPNTTSTSGFTTGPGFATITDASGVNTSAGTRPRIYYKKDWHANTFTGNTSSDNCWKYVEADGLSGSPYDFTIDYSILYGGGVSTNDLIQYFVVAQDLAGTPNIGINSGTFSTTPASVNLQAGNFPLTGTIRSYSIIPSGPLAGDYTVGLSLFNKITGKNLESIKMTRIVKKEVMDDNSKSTPGNYKNINVKSTDKSSKTIEVNEDYYVLAENGKIYTGEQYIKLTPELRKKYNLADNMTGAFTTLTSAIGTLNSVGVSGNVRFLLIDALYGPSGTPETYPLTINQITGASSSATIKILPASGVNTVITGDNTTAIFNLNGTDYLTIDGRPDGSSTPNQLTIRNTNSSTTPSTVLFINDATYNTLQYCVIEGASTSLAAGTIFFSTSTGTTGNDFNTISNCNLRDRSDATGFPTYAIFSGGSTSTTTLYNSDNTISNCNIFNFYVDGNISAAIFFTSGNGDNWVISGNSFYQTDERFTTSTTYYTAWNVVFFGTATMNNITVTNNFIGGSAPSCGGSPWRVTNSGIPPAGNPTFLYCLRGVPGSTTASSFQNNTIANFRLNLSANAVNALSTVFSGILLSGGYVNVGTITGNTIGNSTGTGSIQINYTGTTASTAYTPRIIGIRFQGTGNIENNTIGSITCTGVSTMAGGYEVGGILRELTPTLAGTITNNTIGSPNTANSISGDAYCQIMYGISSSVATVALTVNNNSVSNLTNNTIGTSSSNTLKGIYHSGTAILTANNNSVHDLNCATGYAGLTSSPDVVGIMSASSSLGQSISQNTIYNINSTTTGAFNTYVNGICMTSSTATMTISRNRIYGLTNTSTGAAPVIIGIDNYWGTLGSICSNNQVTITNGEATDKINTEKIYNDKALLNNNYSDNNTSKNSNSNDAALRINNKNENIIKNVTITSNNNVKDLSINNGLINSQLSPESDVSNPPEQTENVTKESTGEVDALNAMTIYGIYDDATSAAWSYYYNSVYIGGQSTSGALNSFCLRKTGYANNINNNIFFNARTNGGTATGKHYAITTTAAPVSNYNVFVTSNASTVGQASGVDQTITQWRTTYTQDKQTWSTTSGSFSATNLFTSISTGNLNINSANTEAWIVSGKGIAVTGQNTDFGGIDTRATTVAGGVTDIGSDEFTSTPPSPQDAIESAPPAAGTTTTYTLWNRIICSILWGSNGTFPNSMSVKYYSGILPNNILGGDYGYSYWTVTPSSGSMSSDAKYSIIMNFGDNETYNISSPSTNTILAKKDGTAWEVYPPYVSGQTNWTSQTNWSAKTIRVDSLQTFSDFALTENGNALPVLISSFNAILSGRNVNLTWVTDWEQNNKGFDVQRRKQNNGPKKDFTEWTSLKFINGNGTTNEPHTYIYNDKKIASGIYQYRIVQSDFNSHTREFPLQNPGNIEIGKPMTFDLGQNYPNPSNPNSRIDFQIPFDGKVTLVVFDELGRETVKLLNAENKEAGYYTVVFDGTNIASGIYFYRIIAEGGGQKLTKTMKMVLVK